MQKKNGFYFHFLGLNSSASEGIQTIHNKQKYLVVLATTGTFQFYIQIRGERALGGSWSTHLFLTAAESFSIKAKTITELRGNEIDNKKHHLSRYTDDIIFLIASCYRTLSVLKKLKCLAPFHVRKLLAESLVLSKLNYACIVYHLLPDYQVKRFQRVQNICAGYVLGSYGR